MTGLLTVHALQSVPRLALQALWYHTSSQTLVPPLRLRYILSDSGTSSQTLVPPLRGGTRVCSTAMQAFAQTVMPVL